jgi:hypothetical protein
MKTIYDELLKFEFEMSPTNSRERSGLIYSKCHELNSIEAKNGNTCHYFVFSNNKNNNLIIKRSYFCPSVSKNQVFVAKYNLENYDDFVFFQGRVSEDTKFKKVPCEKAEVVMLSKDCYHKKILCHSHGNLIRPFVVNKFILYGVKKQEPIDNELNISDVYLHGVGGKKSYGCGLLIPNNVYMHLLNMV